MAWIKPTALRCPKCRHTTKTRKAKGEIAACTNCRFAMVVGGATSTKDGRLSVNKHEKRPVECPRCGYKTKTSKPEGDLTRCTKCLTPMAVC